VATSSDSDCAKCLRTNYIWAFETVFPIVDGVLLAGLPRTEPSVTQEVRLSEVLAGLSYALDLTEGQRPGHAVRSCAIGMRIAEVLGLPLGQRSDLFYALLMKDLGCSSNASRFAALFAADDHDLKAALSRTNWSDALQSFRFVAQGVAPGHFWLRRVWQALGVFARGPKGAREVVETRCERGAAIARLIGFEENTAQAIRALDEHWDGRGQPYALKHDDIPLLGRILGLAQTVEVFVSTYGVLSAYDMAVERRGTWFEPALVDALLSIRTDSAFWQWLRDGDTLATIGSVEPADRVFMADESRLDVIADAFAQVIDAKSPWTYEHSGGVADVSVAIARTLGFPECEIRELRRAALLHDVGKLGVSSLILDKPGKLTDAEFDAVKRHPLLTEQILSRVGCFRPLVAMAAAHHERLDGSGYHQRLRDAQLSRGARVLCVADMFDALRTSRPYRPALSAEQAIGIIGRDVGTAIDGECFRALRVAFGEMAPLDPIVVPPAHVVKSLATDCHQAA
jgi:HD-GYP domain-containing protein (c-di-GMP phosphodiesterase class II)